MEYSNYISRHLFGYIFGVDSEGYPHVSYSKNLDLIYASGDGSRWNTQNLDVTAYVGGYLALDSDENPHMCL